MMMMIGEKEGMGKQIRGQYGESKTNAIIKYQLIMI